jgi:hypothetical protein
MLLTLPIYEVGFKIVTKRRQEEDRPCSHQHSAIHYDDRRLLSFVDRGKRSIPSTEDYDHFEEDLVQPSESSYGTRHKYGYAHLPNDHDYYSKHSHHHRHHGHRYYSESLIVVIQTFISAAVSGETMLALQR